jgi:hypothetical protein
VVEPDEIIILRPRISGAGRATPHFGSLTAVTIDPP